MIFKTFDSDIDKISAKWGIFGKSFNDIGNAIVGRIKDINNGFQATDDLLGSFKDTDSIFKRLYSSKETIQSQMIDIETLFSKQTDEYFSSLLNSLTQQQSLIDKTKGSWTEYFNNLGEGEKWQIEFVQNTDLQKASLNDVKKAYYSARDGAVAHNAALQQQTISAKAGQVALKGLALAGNMLLVWGISELISGLVKLARVSEDVANKAEELGNAFKTTKSEIDDYRTTIEKLYTTINDSGSSIEDVTDARKQLMSVQDELIDKFGTEKETIDLITQAVDNQTEAWERLTEKQWQEKLNEFNNEDFITGLYNWFAGYKDNVEQMVDKMEDVSINITAPFVTDDDFIKTIKSKGYDYLGESGVIQLHGSLQDVYDDIINIQTLLNDYDVPYRDDMMKSLSKEATEAKNTLSKYGNIWDSYVLYEKIYKYTENGLVSSLEKVNDAYKKYQELKASGNETAIEESYASFADSINEVLNNKEVDESVKDYFRDLYPALYREVEKWEFKAKILPEFDIHALNGFTQDDVRKMLLTDGEQYGEATFNSILKLATDYGIVIGDDSERIEQLLNLLVEWGILQGNIVDTVQNTNESIDLSDVFSLKNADNEATLLSNLKDKLSDVKSAYETCLSAKEEYDEQGYLSVDTLQKVISLGDEYLQYLFDEQGNVKLDAEAFKKLTLARINDMEAQALQNLAENIKQITDEATATEYLAQKQNELASSYTDVAINALLAMQQINGFSNSEALQGAYNSFKTQYEQIKSLFANTRSGLDKEFSGTVSDAEQATKDYIESYMDYMEKSLESGRIDYQTYSRDVAKFLKDMYDQGKIAAKDYHDYTKQMLKVQKSIYDAALSAVTDLLDDEIDKIEDAIDAVEKQNDALEKQKTLMENAAQAVVDYYDSLIDGENEVIDALNETNDGIQTQIDKYDSLVNVADRLYEEEQNRLKDEQDAIQEKIDLLNDENSAYDLQYRKEMALYELQRSQQQRTKKLYVGNDKGYVYQTDKSAISDAKKNLQDIQTEELISSLEKEKDALQDSIDALQDYRDALSEISNAYQKLVDERNTIELIGEDYANLILGTNIDDWLILKDKYIQANDEMANNENLIKSHEDKIAIWEDEKSKWQNLSSAIETETNKQAATQQFGADWELQINEGRLVAFDEFKVQYLDIEAQINDNTALIDSYNEKIEYYESLKAQWSDVSSAYEKETQRQCAAQLLGANWESDVLSGRIGTLNDFANDYFAIQQAIADAAWASANEQIRAAKEAEKAAKGSTGSAGKIGSDIPNSNPEYQIIDTTTGTTAYSSTSEGNASQKLASLNAYELDSGRYYIKKKYASGTKNAKPGWYKVSEDEYGDEIILTNDGNAVLAKGEQLYPFEGGETVIKASETEKILANMGNLEPLQTSDIWKKFADNMPDLSSMVKLDIPDYSYLGDRVTRNNVQQPSITIGDIHLHEVNDMNTFANAIRRELPNRANQLMNHR